MNVRSAILWLAMICFLFYSAARRHAKSVLAQQPAITVDADKLWNDYATDVGAADRIYNGRHLVITGVVASTKQARFTKRDFVELVTPDTNKFTQAVMQTTESARVATLQKGQRVKLACVGDGRLLAGHWLSLHECSFVE